MREIVEGTFTVALECVQCKSREAHITVGIPTDIEVFPTYDERAHASHAAYEIDVAEGATGPVTITCAAENCARVVKFANVPVQRA